jgi:Zinc finger, C3HC4 type (RING finger)
MDEKEEVAKQAQNEQEDSNTAGSSTQTLSDSSQSQDQNCKEDEAANTDSSQSQGQTQAPHKRDEPACAGDEDETEESFFSTIQLVKSLNDVHVVHALTQVAAYPGSLFMHCPAPATTATTAGQQQHDTIQQRLWLGKYRHSGEMLFCRIRSIDAYGTCSVVWEDGTMQMGTATFDLLKPSSLAFSCLLEEKMVQAQTGKRLQGHPGEDPLVPTIKLQDRIEDEQLNEIVPILAPASFSSSSSSSLSLASSKQTIEDHLPSTIAAPSLTNLPIVTPELNGLTVWEAAKKGDIETCLALIDRGDAAPNDLEIISHSSNLSRNSNVNSKQQQQHGRSPLYWAAFCGHAELVRELLARGGVDADGSAYLAVTSREKADDNRDLYFDPDEGIFSDGINYNSSSSSSSTESTTEQDITVDFTGDQDKDSRISKNKIKTNTAIDDRTLIRSMLMTAKACPMYTVNGPSDKNDFDATRSRKHLSKELSRSSSTLSTTCSFTSQASVATHQTSAATSHNAQQQELALTTVQSVASLVSIPEACSASSVTSCPSLVSTATNRSTRTDSSSNSTRSSIRSVITIQSKATPADNTGECVICLNNDQPLSICIPCGHISSCKTCLHGAQNDGTGCPLCQERIVVRALLYF